MELNDKLEQLLKQMYAKEALHDEDIDSSDIIDEEWVKFEAENFGSEERKVRNEKFIGVLMLSGIAYAAVHIISSHSQKAQEEQTIAMTAPQSSTLDTQQAVEDSTMTKPVIYEDVDLESILNDVATFYQVEPVFKKAASKQIRLYFTWDKKQTIDDIIDTFNKFERIHITREDKILIVE